jgi:phage head maturation protease
MTEPIQREALPPRDGLFRTNPFVLRDAVEREGGGDGLTLDGYGAVFNRITVIDSWEGRFREQLAPRSMAKSFRELTPKIQFNHGHDTAFGSLPIARFEPGYPVEEVDPERAPEGGAHVVARLFDNWWVQPIRDAIEAGAVDGMSFRFSVNREEWHDADGKKITDEGVLRDLLRRTWMEDVPEEELVLRTLKEVRVSEIGPVVWPAYADTSVGVRSQTLTIDLGRLHEPDQQNKLARAVLMADRVQAAQQDTPTSPVGAVEHPVSTNDTQRRTSPTGDAAEHLSSAARHEIQAELGRMRANNINANQTKERYSS